jgi:hypothetical protein
LRALLRIKQRLRIAAEQEINDYENHGANSATDDKASAAGSANIFNILAFSSSLPEHLFRIVTLFARVYNLTTTRKHQPGKASYNCASQFAPCSRRR